jgi:hypothetical protein
MKLDQKPKVKVLLGNKNKKPKEAKQHRNSLPVSDAELSLFPKASYPLRLLVSGR